MKNKKYKKTVKIIAFISLFTILTSLLTIAYYSNISKFYNEQQNPYGNGEGQHRLAEDFIVDGCGTGTMLDTVTNLCWDKNLSKGPGRKQWALNNTYPEPVWTGTTYNWGSQVATDYPAFKVCDDSTTAGHNDWRMPTRAELLTLIDEIGSTGTTCSTLGGFGFTACQSSNYWSSNQRGSSTTYAFIVSLNNGYSYGHDKTSSLYVACLRRN